MSSASAQEAEEAEAQVVRLERSAWPGLLEVAVRLLASISRLTHWELRS